MFETRNRKLEIGVYKKEFCELDVYQLAEELSDKRSTKIDAAKK